MFALLGADFTKSVACWLCSKGEIRSLPFSKESRLFFWLVIVKEIHC